MSDNLDRDIKAIRRVERWARDDERIKLLAIMEPWLTELEDSQIAARIRRLLTQGGAVLLTHTTWAEP